MDHRGVAVRSLVGVWLARRGGPPHKSLVGVWLARRGGPPHMVLAPT